MGVRNHRHAFASVRPVLWFSCRPSNHSISEVVLPRSTRAQLKSLLRNQWRFLVAVTFGAGTVAALVVAIVPPRFSAQVTFVPQEKHETNPLQGVAAQLGVQATGSTPEQSPAFYGDLLVTRYVLDRVVRTLRDSVRPGAPPSPIITLFGESSIDDSVAVERAIKRLRDRLVVGVNIRTSVVSVSVSLHSRDGVADVARALLMNLERYNAIMRRSQASAERKFTEGRLDEAKVELRAAEDRYEAFLSKNRQYRDSPELVFQAERLNRDVNVRQEVFIRVSQLYEQARVDEVRDIPVLSIVEPPVEPVLPDSRYLPAWFGMGAIIGAVVAWRLAQRKVALELVADPPVTAGARA